MSLKFKVLLAIVIAVGAIVFASYEQHHAREEYLRECQQGIAPNHFLFLSEEAAQSDQCKNADEYMPWWYELISWPSGIGAWVLLLTGGFIGWQSWETRKSAENSSKQIAFQQETLRPRLSIAKFTRDTFTEARLGQWVFVDMKISNSGGTPAYGVVIDTWIEFIEGVPPYSFSANVRFRRAAPINVHTGSSSSFSIPLHRKLTDHERLCMANAKGAICFRARMAYRAFSGEVHSDEAYIVRPGSMDAIAEFTSAT